MHPNRRHILRTATLAATPWLAMQGTRAFAQAYPAKPVKLVVPYPAGGATDMVARAIAERLGAQWGQQVVVDNKPGAGTTVAAEQIARAPGDGYTLYMTTSAHTISASLYKKLSFDPLKDFAPITLVTKVPLVLVASPSLPGLTGFEAATWFGLLAPASMPADLRKRISEDVIRIVAQPEMRKRLMDDGGDVINSTPQQFADFMQAESARWAEAVKVSGAKVD